APRLLAARSGGLPRVAGRRRARASSRDREVDPAPARSVQPARSAVVWSMGGHTMSELDGAMEETESKREAIARMMAAAGLPGVLGLLNSGAGVGGGIGEIASGDARTGACEVGIGGTGAIAAAAELVGGGAQLFGSGGVAGAAGEVAKFAGLLSGGLTRHKPAAGLGLGDLLAPALL